MTQPAFDWSRPVPRFDSGVVLTPADQARLSKQIQRVIAVLHEGWRTVPQIQARIVALYGVTDPEPSISAQIRNCKKSKFGGYAVERRRVGNQYEFRIVAEA